MTNYSLCKKKNCTFFCKTTGTCDYILITGARRGVPVDLCDKFTTAKYSRKKAHNNSAWTKHPDRRTEAAKREVMHMANTKTKYDWNAIQAEIDAGTPRKDVQKKYGYDPASYYYWRNYSKEAKSRKFAGPGKKSRKDNPALHDDPQAAPPDAANVTALAPPEGQLHGVAIEPAAPWYMQDMWRLTQILSALRPEDSRDMYNGVKKLAVIIVEDMIDRQFNSANGG